jgi:hypothetical protein
VVDPVLTALGARNDARDGTIAKQLIGLIASSSGVLDSMAKADPPAPATPTRREKGESLRQLESALHKALNEMFPATKDRPHAHVWIVDVFKDRVIFDREGQLFQMGFEYGATEVQLDGNPVEVVRSYTPISKSASNWTTVIADILPHGTRYLHPFLADDWEASVKVYDAEDVLFVLSQPEPVVPASEVATAAALMKGSWLIETDDTPQTRAELERVGRAFKLDGTDSLFCASFHVDHDAVQWITKATPIEKPFAGFANFQACIDAAKAKGASDEEARKICGALQAESEAKRLARAKHLGRAPSQATIDVLKRELPIIKTDEEQFVMGVVLEPNDGEGEAPVDPDAQQDIYSAKAIRDAAHKFMADFRNMGLMHKQFINGDVSILESFIAPVSFTVGTTKVRKGTWLMALRVTSDKIWKQIKGGELTGFSIGGSAVRAPA